MNEFFQLPKSTCKPGKSGSHAMSEPLTSATFFRYAAAFAVQIGTNLILFWLPLGPLPQHSDSVMADAVVPFVLVSHSFLWGTLTPTLHRMQVPQPNNGSPRDLAPRMGASALSTTPTHRRFLSYLKLIHHIKSIIFYIN